MKHNWEYKRLGEVCNFERGVTYEKSDESSNPTSVRLLRSNNISLLTYDLNFDEIKYLKESFIIKPSKLLKKNSILICMSNGSIEHLGKVAYIAQDINYGFGGFMGMISPILGNAKFIYYVLRSPIFSKFLENLNRGANIRNLQFSKISNLSVPVPTLEVQEQIVEELDEINAMIEVKKEQIKQFDLLAKSIFYDTFGDPVTNPKGWEKKKISEITKTTSGGTPKTSNKEYYDGNIPWLRSGEVKGFITKTQYTISQLGVDCSSAKFVPVNTVAVAMYGATAGQVGLIMIPMTTNQAVCSILPNKSFSPIFLMNVLIHLNENILKSAHGAAQPNISQSIIKSTHIILPPIELQEEFAAKVEAIEERKKEIEETVRELKTLLDSRMDYWFN